MRVDYTNLIKHMNPGGKSMDATHFWHWLLRQPQDERINFPLTMIQEYLSEFGFVRNTDVCARYALETLKFIHEFYWYSTRRKELNR